MTLIKLTQCEQRYVEGGRVCCPVTSLDVDVDLCHDCPNLESFQDSGCAATIHCRIPVSPNDDS
jgi:hypothetical protein